MKQVSGRLRMDLAQYRELAAFSQFGSDLDQATQDTLVRGEHMSEIIKQGQYAPMPVADQVIQIISASEGFTDDVPLAEMDSFETNLVEYVKRKMPEFESEADSGNKLSEDTLQTLRSLISEFKETY